MNLGCLSEIMALDEDARKAREAKIRNRLAKDTNINNRIIQYDGTTKDFMKQAAKISTPKQMKTLAKGMKKSGSENGFDFAGAAYEPITNTIAVNKARNNDTEAIKNGKVDMNSRIMTHELQHKKQFDYIKDNLIGKGKTARKRTNDIGKRFKASYPNLSTVNSDPRQIDKYHTNQLEYDANRAAETGKAQWTPESERAVRSALNLNRGKKLKVDKGKGQEMSFNVLPEKQKQKALKELKDSMPRKIKEEDLPDWAKAQLAKSEQQQPVQQFKQNNQTVAKQVQPQSQVIQQPVQPQVQAQPQVVQQPVQQPQPQPVVQQAQPVQQVQQQQLRPVAAQPNINDRIKRIQAVKNMK